MIKLATFKTFVTDIGAAKIINAQLGGKKVNITTFVVGDGNGKEVNPSPNQTTLVNEVYSGPIASANIDEENNLIIVYESAIPANVGDFYIREVGLKDEDGDLIAVGNYPESYKPVATSGSTTELIVKMKIQVSNTDAINFKIDPTTAIASRDYVNKNIASLEQTVNERLADAEQKVISVDEKTNRELISRRNRKPMITIIDDDGRTTVLDKWVPILQEKNFKMDIAVITGWVGNTNYMTWEQLEHLKREYNVDLVNHTHTHPYLGNLETEAEVREQFQKSTDILKSRGHSYDIMVYPYGSNSPIVRQVAREYCRAGVYTLGGVTTPPLETFRLPRQELLPSSGSMDEIEEYTKYIDEAIEKNGWIIFMSHSQYKSFDAEKIKAIIDYANFKGVEWVHTKEGLDRIGNLIDLGDYVSRASNVGYTILDADGQFHSNNYNFVSSMVNNSVTLDTSISELPEGLSRAIFYGSSHNFPTTSGMVFSNVSHSNPIYSWQMLISTVGNEMYKRQGNSDGTWREFTTVHNNYFVEKGYNKYSADTPITAYPANSVTTFIVNTSGGAGFPNGSAGVVTTYRMHSDDWSRQEYRRYRSNEVWSRYWDGSAWSDWEKISAV